MTQKQDNHLLSKELTALQAAALGGEISGARTEAQAGMAGAGTRGEEGARARHATAERESSHLSQEHICSVKHGKAFRF